MLSLATTIATLWACTSNPAAASASAAFLSPPQAPATRKAVRSWGLHLTPRPAPPSHDLRGPPNWHQPKLAMERQKRVDLLSMGSTETDEVVSSSPSPSSARGRTSLGSLDFEPGSGMAEAERLKMQAEMLKLQAEKLRLEAEREQIMMEREAALKKQRKLEECDRLIAKFREAKTPEDLKNDVHNALRSVDGDLILRLNELATNAETPQQQSSYRSLSENIVKAVESFNERQAKEIREDVAFKLKDQIKEPELVGSQPFDQLGSVQNAMRREGLNYSLDDLATDMKGTNQSRAFATIYAINLPPWLPREFTRMLDTFEPLLDQDVRLLRDEVFNMDTFFVTDVDKTPIAVAFMGRFRKGSDEAFEAVDQKLQSIPGLRDRVQLFLFENPRPQGQEMAAMDGSPDTMFMAVSTKVKPLPIGGVQGVFSLLSLGVTFVNTLSLALLTFYSPQDVLSDLIADPLAKLDGAIPIFLGVLGIQLAHDLTQWAVAASKKVSLGIPIYVPSLQIGTFGSILRFTSFPKNRKDMFDVSVAGPLVGMALSIAAFAIGMVMTHDAPVELAKTFPMLPVALFRSSIFLGYLGQLLFSPDVVNLPLTTSIHLHPLAVVGALGLLANALQFMPIGRLDGGRASTAVFGRKMATFISAAFVVFQVISGILAGNSLQLFWGTVIIVFQNAQELYARDEVTEVSPARRTLLLVMLALVVATILPGVPWQDTGMDDMGLYT